MRTLPDSEAISIVQPAVDEYTRRTVTVDFLYLDNESCERCMGTEDALVDALEQVQPVLAAFDVGITVRDIHVSDLEAAEATRLAVSPTIRIDGRDIQPDYIENTCESCGDLCACEGDVDCRLWRFRGVEYTTAPVELIVEALVEAIVPAAGRSETAHRREAYQLSATVEEFFGGEPESASETGSNSEPNSGPRSEVDSGSKSEVDPDSDSEITSESACGCGC